jgi:hypothetical protein
MFTGFIVFALIWLIFVVKEKRWGGFSCCNLFFFSFRYILQINVFHYYN